MKIYLYKETFEWQSFIRASIEEPKETSKSIIDMLGEQEAEMPNRYELSKNGKHLIDNMSGAVIPAAFENAEHHGKIYTYLNVGECGYCVAKWKKDGTPLPIH